MEKGRAELQAQMLAGQWPARPWGAGVITILSQETLIPREDLADVPGKTNDMSQVNAAQLTLTV